MINYKSMLQPIVGGLAVLLVCVFPFSAYAGLADKYPGDIGIENDPNVVFTENFEEGSIAAVAARWDQAQNQSLMSLPTDVPQASSGQNSLLITHVEGETNGGNLYTRLPPAPAYPGYDQLYLRFYVKFDTDCHGIHHFVHMGGYNPPTPWAQGGAGIRPDGDDRLTTGIEPHGTSWRWDFYSYWMEMRSWQTPEGVPDGRPNPYYGNDFINDSSHSVTRGQWICVELMMKMNNPTTERNGEQALWIDGELWQENGQITSYLGQGFPYGSWFRASWHPDPAGGPFEGFRWRSTENLNLNWLWLLVYITSEDDPGHLNKVWFDDVVVAKEYIGPINELSCDIGDVNFIDYAVLASHWLDETCEGPTWCDCMDFNKDGSVDLYDLAQFAKYWSETYGIVAVEAEDYTSKTDGSGSAAGSGWVELAGDGSSGDGYMQALPDDGLTIDTNIEAESPHLGYGIRFPTAGTYYLWLKGWAQGRGSDSIHYGLDGSVISSDWSDSALLSCDDAFTWRSQRGDGSRLTLTIDSPGLHTLDIWMREDGAKVDSLLLTTEADYIPSN